MRAGDWQRCTADADACARSGLSAARGAGGRLSRLQAASGLLLACPAHQQPIRPAQSRPPAALASSRPPACSLRFSAHTQPARVNGMDPAPSGQPSGAWAPLLLPRHSSQPHRNVAASRRRRSPPLPLAAPMGLSGGAIAGIVIGAVVVAALVVVVGESLSPRCSAAPSAVVARRFPGRFPHTPVVACAACLLTRRLPLPLPACLPRRPPTAMWSCSAERKRREAEQLPTTASGRKQPLPAAPSAKGDRFFSNLMPSFRQR